MNSYILNTKKDTMRLAVQEGDVFNLYTCTASGHQADVDLTRDELIALRNKLNEALLESTITPEENDAELYRHLLGIAKALGYESVTQAMAVGGLWRMVDESPPEEGTPVICHDGFMPYVAYMMYDDAGNEEWKQDAEVAKRPLKWMAFPPSDLPEKLEPVAESIEPVMPREIGTLVNKITGNTRRNPIRVALRCVEEMTELCLAVGATATQISMAVADSIFNQALKLKTQQTTVFPSQLQGESSFDEAVKELADVKLTLADFQYTLGAADNAVNRQARLKYDRLVATPLLGFAVSNDTFYLKKPHVGDNTPATGDAGQIVYESAYTDSGVLWAATDKAGYERDKAVNYPVRRIKILKEESND